MKYLYKAIIFSSFFLYGVTIKAQSTIPASGGNATGTGGTVSYTVGQIVYTKNTGTGGSVSQGVQQPYEISVVTGIKEAKDITLSMIAFPNPATDFVRLSIRNYEIQDLKYQLFDINGSMVQQEKIVSDETNISMQSMLPATYFLKITRGNKEIKTFKIIKK
jgi:hypothetical protein